MFSKPVRVRLSNQAESNAIKGMAGVYSGNLLEKMTGLTFETANIQPERFSNKLSLEESYQKSISAAHDSFVLICKAIEANKELEIENKKAILNNLQAYNDHLSEHYKRRLASKHSIKDYQQVFLDYLQRIEYLLQTNFPNFDAKKVLEKADEYNILTAKKPVLVSINFFQKENEKNLYFVQIEIPEPPLSDKMVEEFLKAYPTSDKPPAWYQGMAKEEKFLFDYTMADVFKESDPEKQKQRIKDKIQSISSRHRTIPGVANFSRHIAAVIDQNGNIIKLFPDSYRSSMVASRDVKRMSLDNSTKDLLRLQITRENIIQIIQTFVNNQFNDPIKKENYLTNGIVDKEKAINYLQKNVPILLQTLISPGLSHQPDTDLYSDKRKTIKLMQESNLTVTVGGEKISFKPVMIIDTNHPLNPARHVRKTGTPLESGDTKNAARNLVSIARASQSHIKDDLINDAVTKAANDLSNLIEHTGSIFDPNHREFHLAALEGFLTSRINGLAHSTCVSGKDRRALEMMYIDAMDRYYFQTGRLPNYSDTGADRQLFIDIFTEIFLTFHQQILAGLNAFGAEGLKNIALYLPNDFLENIKRVSGNPHIFEELDQLANNNETNKLLAASRGLSDERRHEFGREYDAFRAYRNNSTRLIQEEFSDHNAKKVAANLSLSKDLKSEEKDLKKEKVIEKKESLKSRKDYSPKQLEEMLRDIINSPLMSIQGEGFLGFPITPKGIRQMRSELKNKKNNTPEKFIAAISEIATNRLDIKQTKRRALVMDFYEIVAGINNEIKETNKNKDNHWQERLEVLTMRIKGKGDFLGEEKIVANILEDWESSDTVSNRPH